MTIEGKCFENCGRFMIAAPNAKEWALCHGTVFGQGGEAEGLWFPHAWLENRSLGLAMDLTLDEFGQDKDNLMIPISLYRKVGRARDVTEYSWVEACRQMLTHEHFGPWDTTEMPKGVTL